MADWILEQSDDFDRADGPLGAAWAQAFAGAIVIASQRAVYSGIWGGGGYPAWMVTEATTDDQAVEADVICPANNANHKIGLRVDSDTEDLDGYWLTVAGQEIYLSTIAWSLGDFVGMTGAFGADPTFRLEAEGTTLRFFIDGTQRWTDTRNDWPGGPGANHCGLMLSGAAAIDGFRIYGVEPPATVPDAPTDVAAATGDEPGSIDVSWTAPPDGGSPITGYEVDVAPAGSGAWVTHPVAGTSATILGLDPGASYDVRVRAVNAVGASANSGTVTATAGAEAPSGRSMMRIFRKSSVICCKAGR